MDVNNIQNNTNNSAIPQYATNTPIAQKPPKKVYPFNNKDFYFLIFSTVAAFLCIRLGLLNGFNIGFTITYAVHSLVSLIYVSSRDAKKKFLYSVMFVISLILSASFTLHDNTGLKVLTVLVTLFINAMVFNGLSGTSLCNDGTFLKIVDIFYVSLIEPFANLDKLIVSVKTVFKNRNNKFVMVIPGILISIPVLIIVIPLLSSADAAFNTIVKKVFSNVTLLIISLLLTVLAVPFLSSYTFTLAGGITKDKNKNLNSKPGKVSPVFLNTFLLIIGFIYAVFLVSQLAYISDTFAFLLPKGFSAAQFARSGFFQMCAVTALNLIITFLVSVIEKPKDNGRLPVSTKLILTFFTAFSLFLTVNAFIRMSMYIDMYGLTQLRVLTSVFMIMLCIIFVIVLIRIFFEKFRYINYILVTCALTFVAVSVTNIDTHISKYNYLKYTQGEIGVDFEHYESLGSAAIPELIKLSRSDDYITSRLAKNAISDIAESKFNYTSEDGFNYESNFFQFNTSKNKAAKALDKFFKENKSIDYLDVDFTDYKAKVSEYGATDFMPDFNEIDKTFSDLAVGYDYGYYDDSENNTIELVITYDNAVDYKNAFNKLRLKDRTKSTFEYADYTFVLINSDKIDMPEELGIIAYSPDEMTITYLWYQNDKTTYEDISDLEQFCIDNFELMFVY